MIETAFAEEISMMKIGIDGYETTELRSFTNMGNKRLQELIQGYMVLHLERQRKIPTSTLIIPNR